MAQQRRVMAATDDGQLTADGGLGQHRGGEILLTQVRPDGPADFARHLVQCGHSYRAAPELAQDMPGQQGGVQAIDWITISSAPFSVAGERAAARDSSAREVYHARVMCALSLQTDRCGTFARNRVRPIAPARSRWVPAAPRTTGPRDDRPGGVRRTAWETT